MKVRAMEELIASQQKQKRDSGLILVCVNGFCECGLDWHCNMTLDKGLISNDVPFTERTCRCGRHIGFWLIDGKGYVKSEARPESIKLTHTERLLLKREGEDVVIFVVRRRTGFSYQEVKEVVALEQKRMNIRG